MGGKDDIEERIDISGFGFLKKVKDESVFEYTVDEPNKKCVLLPIWFCLELKLAVRTARPLSILAGK